MEWRRAAVVCVHVTDLLLPVHVSPSLLARKDRRVRDWWACFACLISTFFFSAPSSKTIDRLGRQKHLGEDPPIFSRYFFGKFSIPKSGVGTFFA
jgi:hypothetical protein